MPAKGQFRSHCLNGHERVPSNVTTNGACKLCKNMRSSKWRQTEHGKKTHNKQQKAWALKNPESVRATQHRVLYHMSPEQYAAQMAKQRGLCGICHVVLDRAARKTYPCVDHVHDETKRNRGILCAPCNAALGLFQDSITTLQNAIQYLKEYA